MVTSHNEIIAEIQRNKQEKKNNEYQNDYQDFSPENDQPRYSTISLSEKPPPLHNMSLLVKDTNSQTLILKEDLLEHFDYEAIHP